MEQTGDRAMLRAMLDAIPDLALLVETATGIIRDVGKHGAKHLGLAPSEIVGSELLDFVSGRNRPEIQRGERIVLGGGEYRGVVELRTADGRWRSYLLSARAVDDELAMMIGQDCQVVEDARPQLKTLLELADSTDDIFVVSKPDGTITYINAAGGRLHGEQQFVGRSLGEFLVEEDWVRVVEQVISGATELNIRIMALGLDGRQIPCELRSRYDRETKLWYTVEREITEVIAQEKRMKALNSDLRRQATTDPLTGIANRAAFGEAVEQALEASVPFSLLLLDMDNFKSVNDTLGHAAGDEFLCVVARRLQNAVSLRDLVARLGGDEFVIFLPESDSVAAAMLAARLIDAIAVPFQLGSHSIVRGCSIGGAEWELGDSFSDVLRRADQAAYRAKHAGRSRFAMHDGVAESIPVNARPTSISS